MTRFIRKRVTKPKSRISPPTKKKHCAKAYLDKIRAIIIEEDAKKKITKR